MAYMWNFEMSLRVVGGELHGAVLECRAAASRVA